ncbi:hypothetical protein DFQ26_002437 [Actinomortierella ambigua]|nr:hypothetical protein DFQ26_002437 [Actinomortierella ambigua]
MSSPSESKSSPSQRSASRVSVRSSDTVRLYQPVKPAIGNTPSSPVQRRRQRQRQQPVQSIFEKSSTFRTPDDDERRVDDGDKEERQVEQKNQEEDEVDDDDDLDEGEGLEDSPGSRPAVDVELLEQVNKISQHKLDAIDKIMGAKHNSRFTISRKKGQKILAELEKEFGSDLQDTMSDVASPNYDSIGTQDSRSMMAGQSTIRHHDGCETPDGTKTPTAFSTLVGRATTDDPDATIKIRLTGTARSRPPTLIMQYARSESPKEPALQPILNPEQFVTRRFAQWSTVSRLGRRTKKRKSENLYPPSTSSSSSAVSQPVRISPSSSQGSLSSTDQDGNVVIKSLPSDLTSCRAEHAMVPEATQPSKPTSRHILSILELFENKGYDRPKGSTVSSNQSKGKEIASQSPADNQGINSPAWKMAAKVLFHSSSATVAGPSSRKKVEAKGEESSVQQKTTKQDPTVTRGRQGWMTTKRIFQTLTRSNKQKTTKAATEENTTKPSEPPTIVSSGIESFPSQPPSLTIKRFLTSRRKMLSQVLFGSDKTDPPYIETGEAPVSSTTTQPSKSEILGPPVSLPNKVSSAPTPAPASLASAPAATSVPAPVSDSRPGFVSITSLTNVPPPGRRNSLHSFIGRSRSSSGSSNQQQPLLQSVMPPTTISLSSSTVRRNSTQGLMTSMSSTNHQEPLRRHLRVATTNSSLGIGPPSTTSSSSAAGSASKLSGLYQRVEPQSTSRSTSTTTSNSSAATAISSEARESRRSYSSGTSTPVQSNSRAASPIHKLAALFAQDKPATTETAVPASAFSRGTGHSAVSISAPSSPSLKKPDRHNLGTFEVAVSAALPPRPFMQNAVGSIVADTVSPFQQPQWHRSRRLWSRNSSADMYSRYANSSRNNSLNNRRNSSHSTATLGTAPDSPTLSSRRFSSNAEPWLSRLEGSAQPGDQSTTPSSHTSHHQGRPYDNHHHHHYHHRHHQAGLDSVTERHDFLMGDNAFHVPGSTTRSIQDLQEEANDVLRHGGLHLELPLPVSICAAEYDGQRQQPHQQLQQQPQKQQPLQDGTGRSAPKKSVMSLKIAQQELFSTPQHRDSPSPQPNHATPLGDVMGSPKNSGMDNNLHNNNSNNNKNSGTKALQLDLPQTPWLLLATTPERMDHDHGMYRFGGDSPQPRRWGRQDQQQQLQQQHKHRRHHGADSSNSDVDDAEEGDDDDSAEEDDGVTIGSLIEDGHARFTPGLSSASKPLYFDASWDCIKHNNGR